MKSSKRKQAASISSPSRRKAHTVSGKQMEVKKIKDRLRKEKKPIEEQLVKREQEIKEIVDMAGKIIVDLKSINEDERSKKDNKFITTATKDLKEINKILTIGKKKKIGDSEIIRQIIPITKSLNDKIKGFEKKYY